MRSLSVSRRRIILLETLTDAFANMGTLDATVVRTASDELTRWTLHLLTTDPSDDVQYWCAQFLVTRLDASGAALLASSPEMPVLLTRMLQATPGALAHPQNNRHRALGRLVAALVTNSRGFSNHDAGSYTGTIDIATTAIWWIHCKTE